MAKPIVIKENRAFSKVVQSGRPTRGRTVILHSLQRRGGTVTRIGFAVSRQYRSDVARNRMKRLLREAYRGYVSRIKPGWDLILTARHQEPWPTYDQIKRDVGRLLAKADLLID